MYCPAWLRTDRGGARVPAHRSPGHRRSDRGHPGRRDDFEGGVESVIRLALEYPVETLQEWRSSATLQVALPEHTRSQASFAPTPAGAVRRIPVTAIATPRDFSYTALVHGFPHARRPSGDPIRSPPQTPSCGVSHRKPRGTGPLNALNPLIGPDALPAFNTFNTQATPTK